MRNDPNVYATELESRVEELEAALKRIMSMSVVANEIWLVARKALNGE